MASLAFCPPPADRPSYDRKRSSESWRWPACQTSLANFSLRTLRDYEFLIMSKYCSVSMHSSWFCLMKKLEEFLYREARNDFGSSTWRSLHPYKPVICSKCKSKGGENKAISDPFPKQILSNNGAKSNLSKSTSFEQISTTPSSSVKHENMALTLSQFGMIFGNLPFDPTLAIPVIVHDDKVDNQCKCGTSLKISNPVMESSLVHIKQEYDSEELTPSQDQAKAPNIWDQSTVQKKRRSKLPQYTISPIARFIDELQFQHNLSLFYHHPNTPQDLKYDGVLIYEKCAKFLPDNEIGLGAVMLSPLISSKAYSVSTEEEMPSFGDESDAYSNCLIDVPIRSSPSQ